VQLDEELGREEGAPGLHPHPLEGGPPEELAGTVHVTHPEAEPGPIRELVEAGVDRPDRRVRPRDPVADDDVGGVGLAEPAGQASEVRDAELAVAVGEAHEVVAGRPKARPERGAVAEVRGVVDGPDDVGMRRRQAVRDRGGRVLRAVVDGDDLEAVGERRQGVERLQHERLEVRLLVVGREEVGEGRNAGRGPEAHARIVAGGPCAVAEGALREVAGRGPATR
jgi:hypothetical protein